MNQILYNGLGEPAHPIPPEHDPYHVPGTGRRFLEFDPDLANELLDGLGLDQGDDDGFRLRPDGQRLRLTIASYINPIRTDAYEHVQRYWETVGIQTAIDNLEGSLWVERVTGNQYDIAGYLVAPYQWDLDPLWFVPTSTSTYWAPLFGQWYATAGESGERPPEDLRRLQEIYDELRRTVDHDARIELGRQIVRAHDENVWIIGIVNEPFVPVVADADLVNVKPEGAMSNATAGLGITKVEQVAYQNPDEH